ncbi:MAG: hypothetical protein UU65_C0002G0122 [candidate division CPR2 bacterium GW2011_GWC1_41_48]|uniref:Uncharacterized protein n=1 Tax=candidate division CPR2 bacterium GW2011_GWC1_41_48 TaxID=1618344 RepID=A0A0G0W8M5_UNCC2|nr:MAG: hypothetical protein UT47_C0002G0182 [candidate division CPR2 bacterium GW2011_GWC2_39_35]KKR28321.1 MAG: hypothetical protein UT60_C0023G0029 [candidate division CPR2 bacterium GW2011_GWD2_39_7]KKS09344.1 MAG: hypothetical protein UU65_C0002G0122 [candidate division CPR2 bacterium GW2011_GWC1_41_48]
MGKKSWIPDRVGNDDKMAEVINGEDPVSSSEPALEPIGG